MTERPVIRPESVSYEARVALGGIEQGQRENIFRVANKIAETRRFFRPVDAPDRRRVAGVVDEIFREEMRVPYRSVEEMDETVRDPNRSEGQKERAREAKKTLGKGIYVAMRESGDVDLQDRLMAPARIEEVLPDDLKGLGQEVRDNLITNQDLRGMLGDLDMLIETGASGDVLHEAVRDSVLEISRRRDIPRDERFMVLTYLNEEASVLAGLRAGPAVGRVEPGQGRQPGREAAPPMFFGDEVDPVMLGSWQAMQRIEGEIGGLVGTTRQELDTWMFRILSDVGREPLFFAGAGWQQIIPYMERALRNSGMGEVRVASEIERVKAFTLCVMQRENILHCDGDPNNFAERSPPPAFFPEFQWEGKRAKIVREHPIVDFFRDWYVKEGGVIWGDGGGDVVKRLKGSAEGMGIYVWAEDLKGAILNHEPTATALRDYCESKEAGSWNPELLKEQLEMAISYFIVEDYPVWASWALGKVSSSSEVEQRQVPWIDPSRVRMQRPIEKGRIGEVISWNADILGVNHPFLSLARPVDLIRFKGGWDESVLRPLEHALQYLAHGKWGEGKLVMPSEVKVKDLQRWNAMWSAFIGNPRGDALDNFDKLLTGLDKMVDIDPVREDRRNFFGYVAGEVIYAKILALTSGRRGKELDNLTKALAIELSSVPKEREQAMAAYLGSGFGAEYGQVKEAVDRINLNFGAAPHYRDGIDLLITEASSPGVAKRMAPVRKMVLALSAVANTFGGGSRRK